MRINTNISSLQAQRQLSNIRKAMSTTFARLASGKRINEAKDDASGLAISTGLTSQIRGLAQIQKSINDANATIQVADGAIAVQIELVQRMRELAIQSANGTISDSERTFLNSEFSQLLQEVERISNQTEFNGTKILNGSLDSTSIQTGNMKGQTIDLRFSSTQADKVFTEVVGTGKFSLSATYATANTTYRPQIADINGDGYNDIVHADNNDIAIRLNNGSGQFSSKLIQDTTLSSRTFDVGDINNDGKLDIVTPRSSNGIIEFSYGLGNGTFTPVTTLAAGFGSNSSRDLDLVDFNKDGWLDIAQTVVDSGELAVYLNKGDGTFALPTTYSVGVGPRTTDYGDINNDGNIDLVASSRDTDEIYVFMGTGDGRFNLAGTFATLDLPYDIHLKDINEDNILDIVMGHESALSTMLGVGNGTFAAAVTISAVATQYILVEDFNADGHEDIASRSGTSLLIRLGNGDGTFTSIITNQNMTSNGIFGMAYGDLNDDGVMDILAGDNTTFQLDILIAETTTRSAISSLSIQTQNDAENSLDILDRGIQNLISARASLGAQQNRLELAVSQSMTMSESLSTARSQMLDADFAIETAEFTRYQILEQTGITVLSQANMNLRIAISLLEQALKL